MEYARFKLPRMAQLLLLGIACYLVGSIVSAFMPQSLLGALRDIGFVAILVSAGYYLYLGFLWVKRKLFWKIRNKILVSFAFVGVIPVIILLLVSTIFLTLIFKRLTVFYLEHELQEISETLQERGQDVIVSYLQSRPQDLGALEAQASRSLQQIPFGLRHTVIHIYDRSEATEAGGPFRLLRTVANEEDHRAAPPVLPDWTRDGFSNLTARETELSFVQILDIGNRFRLALILPFDEGTVDFLKRRTSMDLHVTHTNPVNQPEEYQQIHSELGRDSGAMAVSWVHLFKPVQWRTGEPTSSSWSILISVPVWILIEHFFGGDTGPLIVVAGVLLTAFLVALLISLAIGGAIARSITSSIHHIYSAVQNIQAGNFGVQVPSRSRDQLDDMADSFNKMSASIVSLMEEVSRREWLEKELEIAKEVQIQLFPQNLPQIRHMQVAASCTPAQQVSGDYYDFLPQNGDQEVDIVLGDISGKGISAALLMASLQSAIRSGLIDPRSNGQPSASDRIARVVKEVNLQLYRRSSPELYSTLVLSHFDSESRTLNYCNAGHHPPLLFSNGRVEQLTRGGTVVGLFESWEYETGAVQLNPDDVLLMFTDGVVEAANSKDEQLGTERVVELVSKNTFLTAEDIQSLVLEQVFEWSAGEEQADDITVVCLKF